MTRKKPRETRLWEFDPSVFQPIPKASFFERNILSKGRSAVKHSLYGLAFLYPIILVTLGVIFGGLAFWASFAGSMAIIWIVLKKSGYARNFESWDIGYKKFLGLFGAFGITLLFVYGLAYTSLRITTIPIMGGVLVLALVLGIWRISNK